MASLRDGDHSNTPTLHYPNILLDHHRPAVDVDRLSGHAGKFF
jgi:hypothetical protein